MFSQILFPVRAILRSINFRCTDFNTDSADACIFKITNSYGVCRLRARVHLKTLSSLRPGSDAVLHMSRVEFEFRPTQINLDRLN